MKRAEHSFIAAVAALAACAAVPASAQHASAFEEGGASVFASACAHCHGENGDLIAGIDLGRGQFRRPFTDNELASVIMNGVPHAGEEVVGRLLNHDTYTVQLLDRDERLRSFRKADLREQGFEDSPMPSYRDKLSEQEIADLVTYLVSLRGESGHR